MAMPGRTPIEVDNETFEVLWQDQGQEQKLVVFRNGKAIGSKEFSHLTDRGQGVLTYAVRSVLRKLKTENTGIA